MATDYGQTIGFKLLVDACVRHTLLSVQVHACHTSPNHRDILILLLIYFLSLIPSNYSN
jgi:hypothetical protein